MQWISAHVQFSRKSDTKQKYLGLSSSGFNIGKDKHISFVNMVTELVLTAFQAYIEIANPNAELLQKQIDDFIKEVKDLRFETNSDGR